KTIKEKDLVINSGINQINQLQNNMQEKITQLNQLQFRLSFQSQHGTAKQRIQNQLSYKLGQTMIINSKNIFGILFMPVYIISTLLSHKQEQKIYQEKIKKDPSLKLPPLENYPDYKEALKLKNHLSYKLGQALIKANKTWYKGGYIKMLFEIRELKQKAKKGK
ncbi:alpha-2,3-sialyltransferase, partial [Campylobacter coli]|nr:alpha-2,3-sialyltransferase [Campylobacter coli]